VLRANRRPARVLGRAATAVDDRFGAAGLARRSLRKAFPDHWSFLLGEIALYSFIILLLTGTFLTLFFQPSESQLIYHGSYHPLDGVRMTEAYDSALRLSFDVRGGLLMRQIHHWAALLFAAAIAAHMLRIFFSGAFRKPRELNWLIGLAMFGLAIAEGFCGYSLPDDLMSGTGLRIAAGILQSVPVIGTYLAWFLFGGPFPGHHIIPRLYIIHVLLIPGLLLALITAHLFAVWHQGHSQWPGRQERDSNEVGVPLYPVFAAKTGALLFFTFGVLALAGALAQINPVWLFGPYSPAFASVNSQPDWYVGLIEGALRIMPAAETSALGHTVTWSVLIPAVLLPLGFFLAAGGYPFLERWATGDRRYHQILDRPRNEPTRTAIGAAVLTVAVTVLLAGGDDVIADHFHIPVEGLVWFFRIAFLVLPVIVFAATRSVCTALQARDRRLVAAGAGTGVVVERPDGDIVRVRRPLSPAEMATMATRVPVELAKPAPRHIVPLPTPHRVSAQVQARLNRLYLSRRAETVIGLEPPAPGHDGSRGAAHDPVRAAAAVIVACLVLARWRRRTRR
jgi:ubiquinol-cytochrome c reductase cytochrome b subunit